MPGLLAEAEIDYWASPNALVPVVLLAVVQLVPGQHGPVSLGGSALPAPEPVSRSLPVEAHALALHYL